MILIFLTPSNKYGDVKNEYGVNKKRIVNSIPIRIAAENEQKITTFKEKTRGFINCVLLCPQFVAIIKTKVGDKNAIQ